jgi:exodeoxyribonuclease VII small subunit
MDLSYEEAVKRLEEIVFKLEEGRTSLDDSLKLYQEGIGLFSHCNKLLENAQLKIVKIDKENKENKEKEFIFDEE